MSLLLAGAKRIETTAGTRAGFHAYRALAQRGPDADSALAHLAALRCAAELGDEPAFQKLLSTWPTQPGQHAERAAALAHRLATNDRPALARILLEAERTRWTETERGTPGAALALYLSAALAHTEGRAELLRRLIATRGSEPLRAKAQLRLAELVRAKGRTAAAAEAARAVVPEELAPAERIRRAEILLLSGSRFQRSAAFSELAELVLTHEDLALRAAVRGLCARLPYLTPLELDRARAVFARLPDEARREKWVSFVDHASRRATAMEAELDERDEPATGAKSALDLQWLHVTLHDLIGRLHDAAAHERAPLERRFAELVAMGAAPAAGFMAFARVVSDDTLQADLLLRAEAAGEAGARRALLDWLDARADAWARAGDLQRAHALAEAAVHAEKTGDLGALRELVFEAPPPALGNPAPAR